MNLDLLVVHDYFMTPTAALADYALPAATWLERRGQLLRRDEPPPHVSFGRQQARVLERFEGGADVDFRDDYEFFYGLAVRLGQEDKWWGPNGRGHAGLPAGAHGASRSREVLPRR